MSVPLLEGYIRTLALLERDGWQRPGTDPGDWMIAVSMLADLIRQLATEIYADHLYKPGAPINRGLPRGADRLVKSAMRRESAMGGGAG